MEALEQLEREVTALRMEVAELRRLVLAHVTDKARHSDPKRPVLSPDRIEYLQAAR